ncbi:MAG: ABC transporter permease [Cyclobacteriaceae bacterium]
MRESIIRWGLRLIGWFCSIDYLDMVQGDLVELYHFRIKKIGFTKATIRFAVDCFVSVFIFFSKGQSQYSINNLDMFRINIVIAYRNIISNKLTTAISMLGLCLGITACLLIVQYIHFETSYDSYHPNAQNIYRVGMNLISKDNISGSAGTYYTLGEQAKEKFPEIINYFTSTFNTATYGEIRYGKEGQEQISKANNVYNVDPSILEMFEFDLQEGSFDDALKGTKNAIMTRSMSERIFSGESAIGKTIYWDDAPFDIVAVVADQPANSHLKFDLLLPMDEFRQAFPQYKENEWSWYGYYNYYELNENADVAALENKFDAFTAQFLSSRSFRSDVFLQKINTIHLESDLVHEPGTNGNKTTVNLLKIIALLIIVIAYTNYVNLTTTTYLKRMKELGIRKVMGSSKRMLIRQLLMESVLINIGAAIPAFILVIIIGSHLPNLISSFPEFYLVGYWWFWLTSSLGVIGLAIISGLYPAVLVSSQKGISVLKGVFTKSAKGAFLHKIMVVIQFLVASVLILFAIIVNKQLNYMLTQDLGVDIEQVLVLKAPEVDRENGEGPLRAFRNTLEANPNIHKVSYSTSVPSQDTHGRSMQHVSSTNDSFILGRLVADENYLPLFEIPIVAGRNFRAPLSADQNGIILNERAVELLERSPEELINQNVILSGDTVKVIGVMANYYHNSVHQEYEPLVLNSAYLMQDITHLSVKISTSDISSLIGEMDQEWKTHFPTQLFDFFFADNAFDQQYNQDRELSKIVNVFSFVAIFIACLGLFAVSLFSMMQRRKEVGIRKVLGTPVGDLFWLLAKGTMTLILISGLVAIPISYGISQSWLSNFANRIPVKVIYLIMPIFLTAFLSMLTITYHIVRTMRINPAETLRAE